MNNQETENQQKKENSVSNRRRFLQKAGAVTPVILTFTSSSSFGATPCFSQQISGNLSNQNNICQQGTITPQSLAPVKTAAIGSEKTALSQSSTFPSIGGYDQLTVFNSVFTTSSNENTFGQIVSKSTESREAVYVAAFMNSLQSQDYILTTLQVIALYDDPSNRPAGYSSDTQFLLSTFQ